MQPSSDVRATPSSGASGPNPDASGEARVYQRNAIIAALPTVAVPVAFAAVLLSTGGSINWGPLALGAAGWLVALVLRTPVILLAQQLAGSPERAEPWVVGASGPCEEAVRVAAVLLVGRAFPVAYSIGLGWSTIEVLYSLVTMFALASLARRADEQAVQARALLQAQGRAYMLGGASPFWGIAERVSASALHVGFTLLLAWQPWLVVVTIPTHSAVNFVASGVARRSVALVELTLAIVGGGAYLAGLLAFGRL